VVTLRDLLGAEPDQEQDQARDKEQPNAAMGS